ncbi:hypothetical protein MYXO_03037 [Myxococcaceae bacterium]|nr:hypothetical protein MYXO_03037 [Myxococcaceae bacterium]
MNSIHPVMSALRVRLAFIFLSVFLAAAWQPATAAIISTEFTLSGFVSSATPGSFDLAALQSYAAANPTAVKTVTVPKNGGGTDDYTGISLNSFLSSYLKTDSTVPKNDFLRDYVVATGTDGYKAAFSLGEINPAFGNQNDIIAYQLNGQDLTTSGFARIVAPGDIKAGRWVSNLSSLEVGHVAYTPGPGGTSTQFTVSGDVDTPITYTAANLPGSLPTSTVTVSSTGGTLPGTTFTGVSLLGLLNQSVISVDPAIKNDILRDIVIATGTDGYQVVFSMGELLTNFGNQPNLLAYANAPGSALGLDGFARTVVSNDLKGGRYASNLTALIVVDATVPEPATALLMLGGLLGLGFGGLRRRSPGSVR